MSQKAAEKASPVIKRGWLTKEGSNWKTWKRRYFVLKGSSLFYYEDENSIRALGELSLIGASVILAERPKVEYDNCIEICTPSRSLFVYADTIHEIKEWAMVIQRNAIIASGGTICPENCDNNAATASASSSSSVAASSGSSSSFFSSLASSSSLKQ